MKIGVRGYGGLGFCLAAGAAEMAGLFALMTAIVAGFGAGVWSQVAVMAAYPVSLGFALWPVYSPRMQSHGAAIRALSAVLVVGVVVAILYYDTAAAGFAAGELGRILGAGFLTLAGGLGWWLGATVAQVSAYPRAATRFQAAMLLLLVLSPVGAEPVGIAIIFFVASVTALALARWESGLVGVVGVIRRSVAPGVAAAVTGLTVLSLVVTVAFSPSVAGAMVGGLGAVADWLRLGQAPQASPGEQIQFKISCSFQPESEEMPFPDEPPEGGPGEPSALMLWIVSGLIAAAVIAGLAIAIIKLRNRVVGRDRRRPRVAYLERRASLLAEFRRLARELAAAIQRIYRRIRTWRPWHRQAGAVIEPGTLRSLYRALLDKAAQVGVPRQPWQTPLEYMEVLGQTFPGAKKALTTITQWYVAARYGPRAVPQAAIEDTRNAWGELQPLIGERRRPGRTT
jgi:hypothetical protein